MTVREFLKKLKSKLFFNSKAVRENLNYDLRINLRFCGMTGNEDESSIPNDRKIEWQYVKLYRKFECNRHNIWGKFYKYKLSKLNKLTGIDYNAHFGRGLIIGHWGRIVLNPGAKFGDSLMISHGVTIGRDIRGKRKGVPTFGNRVVIRSNSVVTGNIKIGNDVLIAPDTFVNFDVPDHSVVIGNPAQIHYRANATEGHLPEMPEYEND